MRSAHRQHRTRGAADSGGEDRSADDLQGLLGALDRLNQARVGFVSITENLDFITPWGKLTLAVLDTLQLAFQWYTTGKYAQGEMAERLNEHRHRLDDNQVIHLRARGRPGRSEPGPFCKESSRRCTNEVVGYRIVITADVGMLGNQQLGLLASL